MLTSSQAQHGEHQILGKWVDCKRATREGSKGAGRGTEFFLGTCSDPCILFNPQPFGLGLDGEGVRKVNLAFPGRPHRHGMVFESSLLGQHGDPKSVEMWVCVGIRWLQSIHAICLDNHNSRHQALPLSFWRKLNQQKCAPFLGLLFFRFFPWPLGFWETVQLRQTEHVAEVRHPQRAAVEKERFGCSSSGSK